MTDRLIEIGTDLGSCWRRITEIQDECLRLPESGSRAEGRRLNRLKEDERSLAERTYALESVVTQLRAASLPAAIVQAVMAHRFVRELMDCDLDRRERQAACRSIERLLYSIVDCLEGEAKERREDMFGAAYMPRDLDPVRSLRHVAPAPSGRAERPGPSARGRPRPSRRKAEGRDETPD